ncbi:MAG: hypothetical protein ACE5HF_09790 [Gemmatimonadota bacterium]
MRQVHCLAYGLGMAAAIVTPRCAAAQTAADTSALATAVARVPMTDQVTARPLPPQAPGRWELLLLEKLDDADLPKADSGFLWLQLVSSDLEVSGDTAQATVHVNSCRRGHRPNLDGHVVAYDFTRTRAGWRYDGYRLLLAGVGFCDESGPGRRPEP